MRALLLIAMFPTLHHPTELFARCPVIGTGYPIERIEIVGARLLKPDTIRAASGLLEGRAYPEKALMEAMDRLSSMHNVFRARFSLLDGNCRGYFVLVIEIVERDSFVAGEEASRAIKR